jgi:hypothetical protein
LTSALVGGEEVFFIKVTAAEEDSETITGRYTLQQAVP